MFAGRRKKFGGNAGVRRSSACFAVKAGVVAEEGGSVADLGPLGDGDAVENPLVDAANGREAHADHDRVSVSVLKHRARPHHVDNPHTHNTNNNVEEDDLDLIMPPAQHQKHQSTYLV